MKFNVGDTVRADGRLFTVKGFIQFQNMSDQCTWYEYRMIAMDDRREYWLSVDDVYREYSISHVVRTMPYAEGYHEVDRGTERVVAHRGDVDVDTGERAQFTEYEDVTEEKIISVEKWSDGKEFSEGYYLDEDEIQLVSSGAGSRAYSSDASGWSGPEYSGAENARENRRAAGIGCLVVTIMLAPFLIALGIISYSEFVGYDTISGYVGKSSLYTYTTSITASNGLKADVYESHAGSVDSTAKDIITGIDGDTEDVTENTEDGDSSVGIVTKKQYCLVYLSEESDKVLVQISDRKYVYSSDEQPYHSRSHTHRFYRRHYYSKAYSTDSSRYSSKYTNSFSGFSDTSGVSDSGSLNSYSSGIRQQSAAARSQSGGGTSYGK